MVILYFDEQKESAERFIDKVNTDFKVFQTRDVFGLIKLIQQNKNENLVVVSHSTPHGPRGLHLNELLKKNPESAFLPFVLISNPLHKVHEIECLKQGVSEYFTPDFDLEKFKIRLDFLSKKYSKARPIGLADASIPTIPLAKRIFDITFALLALLFLSPLFVVVAIILKFDSKGPVFYASKRAGMGYRVFDFYKFRSMGVDADKKLKEISHLNQYKQAKPKPENEEEERTFELCETCKAEGGSCKYPLFFDHKEVCEKNYLMELGEKVDGRFIKVKNDPRVTRFGSFIRNTSIDELPQLFNVLKGDMSIVGNRPLPLYEAEKLTTDKHTLRFMAPAGITGLWQVTKRGKGGPMSDDERMELDNMYARNFSFWYDIKIILKTIPALLQKENV